MSDPETLRAVCLTAAPLIIALQTWLIVHRTRVRQARRARMRMRLP